MPSTLNNVTNNPFFSSASGLVGDPISLAISGGVQLAGDVQQGFAERRNINRLGGTADPGLRFGTEGNPLLDLGGLNESISELQGLSKKPKLFDFAKQGAQGPGGFIKNLFTIGKAKKARRELGQVKATKQRVLDRFNTENESFFDRQTARRGFFAGKDRRLREQQLFGIPTIGNPFFT